MKLHQDDVIGQQSNVTGNVNNTKKVQNGSLCTFNASTAFTPSDLKLSDMTVAAHGDFLTSIHVNNLLSCVFWVVPLLVLLPAAEVSEDF